MLLIIDKTESIRLLQMDIYTVEERTGKKQSRTEVQREIKSKTEESGTREFTKTAG